MRPPRTKTKLSPKPLLLLINLKLRPLKKIRAVVREAIQPLELTLPR